MSLFEWLEPFKKGHSFSIGLYYIMFAFVFSKLRRKKPFSTKKNWEILVKNIVDLYLVFGKFVKTC